MILGTLTTHHVAGLVWHRVPDPHHESWAAPFADSELRVYRLGATRRWRWVLHRERDILAAGRVVWDKRGGVPQVLRDGAKHMRTAARVGRTHELQRVCA